MKHKFKKPELVAPGGSPEKLKIAAAYGADAVYIGSPGLNLRTRSASFTIDDIRWSTQFLHENGKKLYIALNIFAKNSQLKDVQNFLKNISDIPVDALIVSDPGVMADVFEIVPHIPVHLSTQANTTNVSSVNFWRKQGVKRVVLARELSLDEIGEVNEGTDCETEVFVHGAMCMSYSGRCLLSAHLAGRSGNLGDCAHSCRWKYSLKEETRPGESFPFIEDEHGSYILSSKDLCMVQFVSGLMNAGVSAWKIEGRMKSLYYVAAVTRIYREAIDRYCDEINTLGNDNDFGFNEKWLDELGKVSHRTYGTGFFFGNPGREKDIDKTDEKKNSGYIRDYKFLGLVREVFDGGIARVEVKNQLKIGAEVEIMAKNREEDFVQIISGLYDGDNNPVNVANPGQTILMKMDRDVGKYFIIREDSVKKNGSIVGGNEKKCGSMCASTHSGDFCS